MTLIAIDQLIYPRGEQFSGSFSILFARACRLAFYDDAGGNVSQLDGRIGLVL